MAGGISYRLALAPDGYTVCFYKTCGSIIVVDLMAALNRAMQGDVSKLFLPN